MNSELSKLANLVTETVKPVFGGADVQKVQQKPDGSLVSAIDLLLQRRLIDSLRTAWPSVPVLGEEMSVEEQLRIADTGDFFVVDPLDGTTNFINGIPFYAVSLALVLEGRTRMAVTFDPSRDECFAAESGGGAWLGNERLRVASATPKPLAETVAVVDGKRLPEALACAIHRLHPFRSMRNFGSVALEWAWLAAGRI
ncbi:MAG: inositol monophosphatase family protein, partial [Gammaproteobacteria bacterium]